MAKGKGKGKGKGKDKAKGEGPKSSRKMRSNKVKSTETIESKSSSFDVAAGAKQGEQAVKTSRPRKRRRQSLPNALRSSWYLL